MAIKKQKRSLEESVSAGGEKPQNGGGQKNKPEKHVKKIKLEKQSEPLAEPAGSPPKKIKLEKPSHPAPKAPGSLVKIKKEGAPEASLSKNAKREAKLLKKKEIRQKARKEQGQFKVDQINLSKEEIEQRIKAITSRGELSKSARRKLSVFKKKLSIIEGTCKPHVPEVSEKVGGAKKDKKIKTEIEKKANGGTEDSLKKNILNKPPANASVQTKSGKKKAQKVENKKKAIVQPKTEESDEEEEEEDEEDNEEEEDSEEEMDQSQGEASDEEDEDEEEEEDDEEDEKDDDEDEDDDEEEKEEEKITKPAAPVKNIKKEPKTESPVKKQGRPEAASEGGKKKRFVLFVGNLSYQ